MTRRQLDKPHAKKGHYKTDGGPAKALYLPWPKHMKNYPGLPGRVPFDDGYYVRTYDDQNDLFWYRWVEDISSDGRHLGAYQ